MDPKMGFACHCQDIGPRLCPALPLGMLCPIPAVHHCLSTDKLTSRGLPSLLTCHLALNVPRIMSSDRPFAQRDPALCYYTGNGTLMQPSPVVLSVHCIINTKCLSALLDL